jgi:hypothetical protein
LTRESLGKLAQTGFRGNVNAQAVIGQLLSQRILAWHGDFGRHEHEVKMDGDWRDALSAFQHARKSAIDAGAGADVALERGVLLCGTLLGLLSVQFVENLRNELRESAVSIANDCPWFPAAEDGVLRGNSPAPSGAVGVLMSLSMLEPSARRRAESVRAARERLANLSNEAATIATNGFALQEREIRAEGVHNRIRRPIRLRVPPFWGFWHFVIFLIWARSLGPAAHDDQIMALIAFFFLGWLVWPFLGLVFGEWNKTRNSEYEASRIASAGVLASVRKEAAALNQRAQALDQEIREIREQVSNRQVSKPPGR